MIATMVDLENYINAAKFVLCLPCDEEVAVRQGLVLAECVVGSCRSDS